MRTYKAKKNQKDIFSDTYDELLKMFIEDAKIYKEALLKRISETDLGKPYDDDFFRGMAFEGFVRTSETQTEQTKEVMQMHENMREAKRILRGE